MVRAPLKLQTTTEVRGQDESVRKGTSEKACWTAYKASLGVRSRRVRPNSQSSTSAPALNHSSVQEKTNTPAQPVENAVRICALSAAACAVSPLRIPSKP